MKASLDVDMRISVAVGDKTGSKNILHPNIACANGGWSRYSGTESDSYDTENYRSFDKSYKVITTQGNGARWNTHLPIMQNRQYTASVYLKGSGTARMFVAQRSQSASWMIGKEQLGEYITLTDE